MHKTTLTSKIQLCLYINGKWQISDMQAYGEHVVFPLRRIKVWTCVWMPERKTSDTPSSWKDSGSFSVVNLLNQSFYFSFLWIHWAHLKPNSVHASPPKGRKNSRFKSNVLVSYSLKSKRDKNIKWGIPRIKLHVIIVQPTSVNTVLHGLHRFHYRFGNRQYW